MDDIEKMELRSEKIRRIIRIALPGYIRYGNYFILSVLAVSFLAIYLIPFSYKLEGRIVLWNTNHNTVGLVTIPSDQVRFLDRDHEVVLDFRNKDKKEECYVEFTSSHPSEIIPASEEKTIYPVKLHNYEMIRDTLEFSVFLESRKLTLWQRFYKRK